MKKLLKNKRVYVALVLLVAAVAGANVSPEQADQIASIFASLGAQLPV